MTGKEQSPKNLGQKAKETGKALIAKSAVYFDNALQSTIETTSQLVLITDLKPEVHLLDTKGLQVTVQIPVTHTFTTPPLKQRAKEAAENFLQGGKLEIPPALPKGKKDKNTVTHPTASSTIGNLPAPGINLRQNILDITTRGGQYPCALLQLAASGTTKSFSRLKKNGVKTSIESQEAAELSPVIESELTMLYYDQQGQFHKLHVPFTLGQEPLTLNSRGEIENIFTVGEKSFHPALLGLKSLSEFLAYHIYKSTDQNATINPSVIEQALILSAHADEDTNKIIQPHIERMLAVDIVEQLIHQKPSEFLLGFFNAIEFTTDKGVTHPQQNDIRALIAATVIPAFEELPDNLHRTTSFVHLVQNISKITTQFKAYINWSGDHRLVQVALDSSRSLKELHIIIEQMEARLPPVEKKAPQPIEPRIFLTLSTMPAVLLAGAISYISESQTHADLSLHSSQRAIRTSQMLRKLSSVLTKDHLDYLERFEKSTIKELKKLPKIGAEQGKLAGQKVIEHATKQIPLPEDDFIDIKIDPVSDLTEEDLAPDGY